MSCSAAAGTHDANSGGSAASSSFPKNDKRVSEKYAILACAPITRPYSQPIEAVMPASWQPAAMATTVVPTGRAGVGVGAGAGASAGAGAGGVCAAGGSETTSDPDVDRLSFGEDMTGQVYDAERGASLLARLDGLGLVAYEDDDFLVLNKPFDVQISADGDRRPVTLDRLLALARPDVRQPPFLCHQLDYIASGCIAVATSKKAARFAGKAFERRKVQKRYVALVYGHLESEEEEFDIDAAITDTPGSVKMALARDECTTAEELAKAKSAVSHVRILGRETLNGEPVTRLGLVPHTGRRHQLRVHCALVLKHPIVGDFTYAPELSGMSRRTYLHSERLAIPGAFDVTIPASF